MERSNQEEGRRSPKLGQPIADSADWLAFVSRAEMLASEP